MLDKNDMCVVGSRISVNSDSLKNDFERLFLHVTAIVNDKKIPLHQKHNVYTSYTLKILNYLTGHRPVKDPYCFNSDVDIESGLLIISDKVTSESTKARLVWLCDVARQQFYYYVSHLNSLSEVLYSIEGLKQTAQYIAGALSAKSNLEQPIPLLFYLDDQYSIIKINKINKRNINRQMSLVWPYEDNHNRHFLETELFNLGTPAPYIDLLLGHTSYLYHYLGSNSSCSAYEIGKEVTRKLNMLAEKYNLRPIKWQNKSIKIEVPPIKVNATEPLGYILRDSEREKDHEKVRILTRKFMAEEIAMTGGISKYLNEEDNINASFKTLLSDVIPDGLSKSSSIREACVYIKYRAINSNEAVPRLPNFIETEVGPFEREWPQKYKQARIIREEFVFLASSTSNDESIEYLWAKITLSALMMTGMHNQQWLLYLLRAGPRCLRKIKKWLYYADIWVTSEKPDKFSHEFSPDWRWQPDSFSKSLILSLFKKHTKREIAKYSPDAAIQHLKKICRAIDVNSSSDNIAKVISKTMEPFWRYHLPRYINDIYLTRMQTTPLPACAVARLLYGTRMSTRNSLDLEKDFVKNTTHISGPSSKIASLMTYYVLVTSIFNDAEDVNNKSIKNKNKRVANYIINRVNAIHSTFKFDDTAELLSIWLIKICDEGGKRQKILTLNTIKKYFSMVASPLANGLQGSNLEDVDVDEVTDLYYTAINFSYKNKKEKVGSKERYTRLQILIDFHRTIVDRGIADLVDPDWSYICEGVSPIQHVKSNANIITPDEYINCLDLIKLKMPGNTDYERIWPALFIIFGYRFALRINEIRHLRIQDVNVLNNNIYVQVQNTRLGTTKTRCSVRQVPLLGEISGDEIDLLVTHIKMMRSKHECDKNALLLPDAYSGRDIFNYELIRRNVHALLKHVSGDPRVVFHHLRHSYINHQYISGFMPIHFRIRTQQKTQPFMICNDPCEKLIGSGVRNIYRLHALSRVAGHLNTSTTIQSYIHVIDDIATAYADHAPTPSLSMLQHQNITGIPSHTLYNRYKNMKSISLVKIDTMLALKDIQIGDEIEKYDYKLEKFPKRFEFYPQKPVSVFVSRHRSLVDYYVYGDSLSAAAYTNNLSIQSCNHLVKHAYEIYQETNFEGYINNSSGSHRKLSYDNFNNILEDGLHNLEEMKKNSEHWVIINRAADVWRRCYRQDDRGYCVIITKPSDLGIIISLTDLLAIKSDSIIASKPSHFLQIAHQTGYRERISLSDAEKLGMSVDAPQRIRALDRGTGAIRYDFLRIAIRSGNGVFSNKSMLGISYILYMALLDRKISDN